jgi:hypothetical protein
MPATKNADDDDIPATKNTDDEKYAWRQKMPATHVRAVREPPIRKKIH